jgi:hypothetical protein
MGRTLQTELWMKNLLYVQDPVAIISKGMVILKQIMKCFTGVPGIFPDNSFICIEISTYYEFSTPGELHGIEIQINKSNRIGGSN